MLLVKKFLILFTVIIFLIIIWRLIIVRIQMRKEVEKFSLFSNVENKELTSIESTDKVVIKSVSSNDSSRAIQDLSLCELCIKGSYNSALSGNYINLDMLQYVINRGCRYLDFEVLYIPVDPTNVHSQFKPVVGYTTSTDFSIINSENTILLNTVLASAISNAFTSSCPNNNDPLFINLRIKSNNVNVYSDVASAIDQSIQPKIYASNVQVFTDPTKLTTIYAAMPVTRNTKLKDIMGHVIISVDKTIFPNYIHYTSTCDLSGGTCYDLTKYTNIQNGSEDMNLILYSMVSQKPSMQILNDNLHTNVKNISVANPDNLYLLNPSNKNPNYGDYILKYGCQWVPYRFYQNDSELQEYEKFFNDHNSGIIPLASAISYYMNKL
jgi:hypothetical protein